MSDAMSIRRLCYTPLRDLARGRVTGRLNYRQRITDAALPLPVAQLITSIVRRTHLWRSERAEVADELIAHFSDGLAAGETADALIHDFGDGQAVAKLIRRAMKRRRSIVWHLAKYAVRIALVILLLDVLLIARFLIGRPTVRVDYLAQLNTPIERVPETDRAWPLYRQAILGLGVVNERSETIDRPVGDDGLMLLSDIQPSDKEWPQLTAWLDAHQPGFEILRQAASKPAIGYVLGPNGSAYDPEIGFPERNPAASSDAIDEPILSILLCELKPMRRMADRLSADVRYAREQGDAARVVTDLTAMHGMARQLREADPFVVTQLVSIGIDSLMLRDLRDTVARRPELLSDSQLVGLAHRIAWTLNGDTASAFLDISGEQLIYQDIIQRLFTDDGHGDGRMSSTAIRWFDALGSMGASDRARKVLTNTAFDDAAAVVAGSVVMSLDSRRDNVLEFQRLYALARSDLERPRYAIDPEQSGEHAIQERLQEISASPTERGKLLLVPMLMPSFVRAGDTAERLIASRDGTLVAIALELYRRHHGAYPTSLDDLVPTLLPAVPKDRITGEPIHYRLVDGKPVVYSVGADRDDDGGRAPVGSGGQPDPTLAAAWETSATKPVPRKGGGRFAGRDGDWVLFDARPKP